MATGMLLSRFFYQKQVRDSEGQQPASEGMERLQQSGLQPGLRPFRMEGLQQELARRICIRMQELLLPAALTLKTKKCDQLPQEVIIFQLTTTDGTTILPTNRHPHEILCMNIYKTFLIAIRTSSSTMISLPEANESINRFAMTHQSVSSLWKSPVRLAMFHLASVRASWTCVPVRLKRFGTHPKQDLPCFLLSSFLKRLKLFGLSC